MESYSTQGQAGNTLQAAKRDSIQEIANDANLTINRLAKLSEMLALIGNRIEGQRPEPANGAGKPESPPVSILMDLRRKHGAIADLLDQCEQGAHRIAEAVGIQ